MQDIEKKPLGSYFNGNGTTFTVWATQAKQVEVVFFADNEEQIGVYELEYSSNGYYGAYIPDVKPGSLYKYRLNRNKTLPDPASRYQPKGSRGPFQVVDTSKFIWKSKK